MTETPQISSVVVFSLIGKPIQGEVHTDPVPVMKQEQCFLSGSANTVFTQAAPHVYPRLKLMTRPKNLLTWLELHIQTTGENLI